MTAPQAEMQSDGAFEEALAARFTSGVAKEVISVFKKMQRPIPRRGAFMSGTDGLMVLDRKTGVVIRIENAGVAHADSLWVVQPVSTIYVASARIEICPGVRIMRKVDWTSESGKNTVSFLSKRLRQDQVNLWDDQVANIGRLPVSTQRFPKGIPVVIDRGAVTPFRLWLDTTGVTHLFNKKVYAEEEKILESFYAPLQKKFDEAWPDTLSGEPDPEKMTAFWRLCASWVRQGRLVSGWVNKNVLSAAANEWEGKKIRAAITASRHYKS